MIKYKNHNQGFTLVEMLIVIGIIGLLSTLTVFFVTSANRNSRDLKRIAEVKELQKALEFYYLENGHYPISLNCGGTQPGTSWCNSVETLSANGHWIKDSNVADVLSPYINREAKDPKQHGNAVWPPNKGGTIYYFSSGYGGSGKWYMIVYGLEKSNSEIESKDGVTACDSTYFHYGNGTDGIITVGANCVQ